MATKTGVIYKLTCTSTGMSYIGQSKTHKTKNGKPYNYGSSGRWSDHKSSAKKQNTPLAKAIQQYGGDAFTVTDIETVEEADLDACEAHWIETENTLQPNGYNVMSHSRNKHNKVSGLYNQYVGKVALAEIHTVHNEGENAFVYLYLILHDGSSKRLTFGQNKEDTFDGAKKQALEFAEELDCEIKDLTGETHLQQARTLAGLTGTIKEITITTASSLIAVYIFTSTMKMQKERMRICFGGKTVSKAEAYKQAHEYIKKLPLPNDVKLIDKLESLYNNCRQQAAAITS
jgi:hypothetical protein